MLPRLATFTALAAIVAMPACDHRPAGSTALRLIALDGRSVDPLDADERVLVFLFTRTDCPISNRYAPEVRRLAERFAGDGVAFCLVYPDPDTTAEQVRAHLREYSYTCRALRDPAHALVERCGATITPEAAVFGPERSMLYRGRIDDRYLALGQVRPAPTRHDLEDAIAAAVQDRPVAAPRTEAVGCFIGDLDRAPP